jgi:arylsulfatase A-like enzyme
MRVALVAVWAVAVGGERVEAAGGAGRPNVIVIVGDEWGYADMGVQGISKDVVSPNLDSIATNGVRFTSGYVSCPVCSPTRAGFLTGRYQQRFGHELNPIPPVERGGEFGMPVDQVTMADEMKRGGYVTGLMGKWHLGARDPKWWPTRRGFDEFFGFLGGAHTYTAVETGVNALRRGEEIVKEEKEYLTDAISREAVSFIERHQEKPFFLYVAYNAVHTPMQAPEKYLKRFEGEKDEKRRYMLAMLSAADDGVGRILGALREKGLEEKTLVVYFSDNGGPTHANASRNTPLRGYKGQVFEGGIRVPFMAQWKGRIPAGRVIDEPVIQLDVMPTALAAAGIERKEGAVKLDGVNLLPWLEGKGEGRPHETLYWRFSPAWAVRDGDWKLVKTKEGVQLFDLGKDVGETRDLSKERPEVRERLQGKFDQWNGELMEPLWPGKQEGEHQGLQRK